MHLAEYMALKGVDDDQVAEAIERSRVTVSRIRRRLVRPDWDTIRALRKWSSGAITAADFESLEPAQ